MNFEELLKFLKIRAIDDGAVNTLKFLNEEITLIQYIDTQILNEEESIRYYENRIKEEQLELENEMKKEKPYNWAIKSNKDAILRFERKIQNSRSILMNLNHEKQKLEKVE